MAGAVVTVGLLVAACGGSDDADVTAPASTGSPSSPAPALGSDPGAIDVRIALTPVADGLDQPTALAARPDGSEVWVTEQGGAVRRVTRAAGADPRPDCRVPFATPSIRSPCSSWVT